MALIKNVSGSDLVVPGLGGRLVVKGAEVDVDPDNVYAYTCQTDNWQPADAAAKKAHSAAVKALTPDEPDSPADTPQEG